MTNEEKEEYMSMLTQLMRKNRITFLEFTIFGINELCEIESYTEEMKRNISESLCNQIQDNF